MLENIDYNPDVLTCLANLSNDEVFTPPELVNDILDLLPKELFKSKETTFLDPVTKSGVFLREIAKRLMNGLESEIPDQQTRINHIFKNQLYGIAITELTSLLARRSVYCSKEANGKYSICEDFETEQGNILFERIEHTWKGGKCKYCGASEKNYERGDELETYAYQFIHTGNPEEIFNMKFDVIIGNPPYQLDTGGSGRQAKPIYNKFIEQAKKLNPTYLTMITPSRWFAGGMGLANFRKEMLNDKSISHMVDYTNAKDCFDGISISGGVSYFLWDKNHNGPCIFNSIHNGVHTTLKRHLNDFSVLVRYNQAVKIINKVRESHEEPLNSIVSSINPFGFGTSERGGSKLFTGAIKLRSSKGIGFVDRGEVTQGLDLLDKYKVIISQTTSEHAGEPSKDGKYKLLATVEVLKPEEICTFSYITLGLFETIGCANNLKSYLLTKFARFLLLQTISSIHISKDNFQFVPMQDFSESWTDEKLYKKYDLDEKEIAFIEAMIRPMGRDNE
jgi:site-specific DNA-methyltransferase (adenine-specific)